MPAGSWTIFLSWNFEDRVSRQIAISQRNSTISVLLLYGLILRRKVLPHVILSPNVSAFFMHDGVSSS